MELYHHGVLGQRWGVRRNRTGSVTSSTQLNPDQIKKAVEENENRKKYNQMLINSSHTKMAKDIAEGTGKIVAEAKKMSDENIRNGKKKVKLDLSKMSDEELRNQISRADLEKRYNDLFAPEVDTVTKGQRAVNNLLSTAGSVLAVGTSALSVALMIKEMRLHHDS